MLFRLPDIIRLRVRSIFSRSSVERDLDDELRYHIEAQSNLLRQQGMTEADALAEARRRLGHVESLKEQARDTRRVALIEHLRRDFRYALRVLRRSPAFVAVAVLSLALAIGASITVFSVLDPLILRKLPVRDPDQLVFLRELIPPTRAVDEFSVPQIDRFRAEARSLASVTMMNLFDRSNVAVGGSDAVRTRVAIVSGDYFQTIGVTASRGRVFDMPEDSTLGGHPVAVISDAYWSRAFQRRSDAIGTTLKINSHPFTIIGIMPGDFRGEWGGRPTDVWVPWTMHGQVIVELPSPLNKPADQWLHVMARLKPGVSIEAARTEIQLVHQRFLMESLGPGADSGLVQRTAARVMTVLPASRGYSPLRERLLQPVTILGAVCALVLLVAIANVAGLLAARTAQRRRELALRLAIGAAVGRVRQQLLVESLVLAVLGGLLGFVFAFWGASALGSALVVRPVDMYWARSSWLSIGATLDARSVVFGLSLSVGAGLLCGLSALRRDQTSLAPLLGGRSGVPTVHRISGVLVAGQVALSLIVAVAAGLLVRTVTNLREYPLGFDREHLLFAWTQPSAMTSDPQLLRRAWFGAVSAVREIPGVVTAGGSNNAVLNGEAPRYSQGGTVIRFEGRDPKPTNVQSSRAFVSPGFFAALGTPLVSGREFTEADTDSAAAAVMINESMARFYFGNEDPVGRRMIGSGGVVETVIGVVKDFEAGTPRADGIPWFRTFYNYRDRESGRRLAMMMIAIRTRDDPRLMIPRIRDALAQAEPTLPVLRIDTADEQLNDVIAQDRLIAVLAVACGGLAGLLACLGLYGIIAYTTEQRTPEIGVRVALGATAGSVRWMVLRQAIGLVVIGIAIGIPITLGAARFIQARLYRVSATDPWILLAASGVLTTLAVLAAAIPARRAASVDPMIALRAE